MRAHRRIVAQALPPGDTTTREQRTQGTAGSQACASFDVALLTHYPLPTHSDHSNV